MNVTGEPTAEIENPMSANWSVFRNSLLPSLMDFLSRNRHVEYPQKIFEVGTCVLLDESRETKARDVRKVAAAVTNSVVSYEEISSLLDAFLRTMNVKYSLKKHAHRSFIEGRCASIIVNEKVIGLIGEIHPQVLNNWKLEKPVVAFEMNLEAIS
jgi:phenylalanyl-tRNA synthetase beta chain